MGGTRWVPLADATRFACSNYRRMYEAVNTRALVHRKRRNKRIEVTYASLVAYCDKQVEQGKLIRTEKNGEAAYSPAE